MGERDNVKTHTHIPSLDSRPHNERNEPIVSHGRGGQGNIAPDPTPYVDAAIVREGPYGDQGDGAYSAGVCSCPLFPTAVSRLRYPFFILHDTLLHSSRSLITEYAMRSSAAEQETSTPNTSHPQLASRTTPSSPPSPRLYRLLVRGIFMLVAAAKETCTWTKNTPKRKRRRGRNGNGLG